MGRAKDFGKRHLPTDAKRADTSKMPAAYALRIAGARTVLPWGAVPGRNESQRRTWVWVEGDVSAHHEAIIAAGGRWSGKRKQYYIPGVERLPVALEAAGLKAKVCRAKR